MLPAERPAAFNPCRAEIAAGAGRVGKTGRENSYFVSQTRILLDFKSNIFAGKRLNPLRYSEIL
jgi:hypothetical protein